MRACAAKCRCFPRGLLSALLAASIALPTGAASSRAEESRTLRSAVSARLKSAQDLGVAPADETLDMSITLNLQNRTELDDLLAAQQRPDSPLYRHWLTPDEFAARFGGDAATYAQLADWLRAAGFAVRTWPSRTRIDFHGSAAAVEAAFAVPMRSYRRRGRRALANSEPPLLPARFAAVMGSLRLNTFPLAEPLARVAALGATVDAMAPRDIYTVYGFAPLLDGAIDGSGQMIAIIARSDFDTADVTRFQQQFGLPERLPVKAFPGRNPGIGSPNYACSGIRNPQQRVDCLFGEEAEVLLDAQWAGSAAPGATVLVDVSDRDIDLALADVVSNHPEAKVISMSFGLCERLDPSLSAAMEPLYAQAAAQGQTVLVAAGNQGADGCDDMGKAAVNALSSSALVTGVGGTGLDPGFDANGDATGRVSEVVWNDSTGAGGGGVSGQVAKPEYQSGPGVPDDGFRDQPDVSLMASPYSAGYFTVVENGVEIFGGTSVATPIWAGIVALANQAAGADGLGPINRGLYQLGARQYGNGEVEVFHDVTSGDNEFNGVQGYPAGPGFDLASGLGTPRVAALVQELAAPSCGGDCNGDGSISVDELVTAVRIALGTLPLSACAPVDLDADGTLSVDELVRAVNRAMQGC